MRCMVCGCDKAPAAFTGAQKKRPAAKRKCASCTAANGSDAPVHAGAASPSLASHVTDNAPLEEVPTNTTTASTTEVRAAAAVEISASSARIAASRLDGGEADTMACSACGKQLAGTTASHQNWKKCSRCKLAFYCNAGCQRKHWKRGGHKQACSEPMPCIICLDNDGPPLPIQGGCACRAEGGCAHVSCRIKAAEHQGLGFHTGWSTCPTCTQMYTGAMNVGLAEALWERHRRKPARNRDRLCAQSFLSGAYMSQGRSAAADTLLRDILATQQRSSGGGGQHTFEVALNLGLALLNQGKDNEAEAVFRDALPRVQRLLGPEHDHTLAAASALATALGKQDKHAEAEPLLRDTLAIRQRVLGAEHSDTLQTCTAPLKIIYIYIYNIICPPIFPIFLPHFRLYGVVSVIR